MINLNKLAKEVHENAVAHGWWETERDFGEIIALIHSEVSEVLEEYRNGHGLTETYYSENGKPEGIPSEMADIIIRVIDICGKYDIKIDEDIVSRVRRISEEYKEQLDRKFRSFGDTIAQIHQGITIWYENGLYSGRVADIIAVILGMSFHQGIDIEKAIIEKHEFNKTRPYKHGGKLI